jgi:hypothetical protein
MCLTEGSTCLDVRLTEQESRAYRLAFYVRFPIRVLLQVEFLAGPRTQNSPDLAAVHRTLV